MKSNYDKYQKDVKKFGYPKIDAIDLHNKLGYKSDGRMVEVLHALYEVQKKCPELTKEDLMAIARERKNENTYSRAA